jgi:hypothetical protein
MDEVAAREVVLVRAIERAEPELDGWTAADRAWATRVAAETVGAQASDAAFVAARAHAALQRLLPRDRPASAAVWRWLQRPLWRPAAVAAAVAVGLLAGVVVDRVGGSQHVNLLAPPVWGLLAWNLAVFAALAWRALAGLVRRRAPAPGPIGALVRRAVQRSADAAAPRGLAELGLARLWPAYAADWVQASAPLAAARAAALLHAGAAALAAGLVAGLYLRGLVLDYRAGWQSTFLEPATVHAVLATLLAPASALSGIALPDVAGIAALRVGADGAGGGPAAPWIHLYAGTLALAVVVPRALLAAVALARAARWSRRFPLRLDEPYFRRMLRPRRDGPPRVVVWPHARAPSAAATLALRETCARLWGDAVQLDVRAPVAHGDEDSVAAPPAADAAIVLCEMGATPEAEQHGRLLRALAAALPAGVPLVLVVDEGPFRARFAGLDERLAQRHAAWAALARSFGTAAVFVDLEQPDVATAEQLLQAALERPVQRDVAFVVPS